MEAWNNFEQSLAGNEQTLMIFVPKNTVFEPISDKKKKLIYSVRIYLVTGILIRFSRFPDSTLETQGSVYISFFLRQFQPIYWRSLEKDPCQLGSVVDSLDLGTK